jgi:hypothetical protein
VLLVIVPTLLFAGLALGADIRAWWRRTGRASVRPTSAVMLSAAALSAASALIHAAVCRSHFQVSPLYGAFFAVAAGTQLAWSIIVATRTVSWTAPTGLLGNAALAMVWVVTRTIGLPVGPGAGVVERVGVLDVVSTVCEIGVAALCAVAIRQHVPSWRTRRSDYATHCSTV